MFDDLNDPHPPPVDLSRITARARVLRRRRRTGALAASGVAVLAAGSVLALQLGGGHQVSLSTTNGSSQVADQPCLSTSLTMSAVWSSEAQTYYQPTASPPSEQHGTESQGYINFANSSGVTCTLEGAPTLAILGADGEAVAISKPVQCIPGPCTFPGDVILPDGSPGRILAPGESAAVLFHWGAPYCGAAPGQPARMTVTFPGGDPVTVDLVDRDPAHPGMAPTCGHDIPGVGTLQAYSFQPPTQPSATPTPTPS